MTALIKIRLKGGSVSSPKLFLSIKKKMGESMQRSMIKKASSSADRSIILYAVEAN